jgi:APA family basic amino acid/polyamine antiporter
MSISKGGQLLNVLGLAFGLAGSVGGTIGAGILRTPGLVAAQLHLPSLIQAAWLAGGLYALMGVLCIAELAASLPRAGGWYVYAEQAFGRRAAFVVGFTDWLAHCIGLAWVATTVGDYLIELGIDLLSVSSQLSQLGGRMIALMVLMLFTGIQLLGVRAGGVSQELLSLAKAITLLGLVAACFMLPVQPDATAPPPQPLEVHHADWLAMLLALQAVITTYDGWASPVYFAEEFEDPAHDLPRSLIGGVLTVLVLYLLINAALLHVLPLARLAISALPAADAAGMLLGNTGRQVIIAVALVALLGLINTVVMAAPRILYGLGRDGLLPAFTAQVSGGGTPLPALMITTGCSAVLVWVSSFEQLLGMGAFLYVGLPLSGIAALVALRHRQPNLPRPFRCWGYPLTPLLVGVVSLSFLVAALLGDPLNSLLALGLVVSGALGLELLHRHQTPA